MIIAVKLVMTLATVLFALGLYQSKKNIHLHRLYMKLGFLSTLSIAVVLVAGVHFYGVTYGPAAWLVNVSGSEATAGIFLVLHRVFATVALIFLITQIVTGIVRHPLHLKIFRYVIITWVITYTSGLFLFG